MILAIFVDGLGLGAAGSESNPTASPAYPALAQLRLRAIALDAALGVPGLPQSSTGQTSLLCGVNAARLAGGHRPGFPGAVLREVIWRENVYLQLTAAGGRSAFANAFGPAYLRRMAAGTAPLSATTLAAVAAGLTIRDAGHVLRGEGVYHDLTGHGLIEQGLKVPLLSPAQAAAAVYAVARRHDLTLFEYFLTDSAGHLGDAQVVAAVLGRLDAFLGCLAGRFESGPWPVPAVAGGGGGRACYDCLVVFSDHGNIEDSLQRGHTLNPVPLAVWSDDPGAVEVFSGCRTIADVAGALLRVHQRGGGHGDGQQDHAHPRV